MAGLVGPRPSLPASVAEPGAGGEPPDIEVWSFGGNASGQLGHNDTTARQVATRIEYFVSNSIVIADIFPCADAGGSTNYVFFLTTGGAVYACGANGNR